MAHGRGGGGGGGQGRNAALWHLRDVTLSARATGGRGTTRFGGRRRWGRAGAALRAHVPVTGQRPWRTASKRRPKAPQTTNSGTVLSGEGERGQGMPQPRGHGIDKLRSHDCQSQWQCTWRWAWQ